MLPKTSAYVTGYDTETKWVIFFIENDEWLKKYNDIWSKIRDIINKELDCKPIYNKNCLKSKLRSYGDAATDSVWSRL